MFSPQSPSHDNEHEEGQLDSFWAIDQSLEQASDILIVSHLRPDGDALGSSLAAALWLKEQGHHVEIWNEDGLPEKFSYLPNSHLIQKPPEKPKHFDAVLSLDAAAKHRLGDHLCSRVETPLWLMIDHHHSHQKFGNLQWINPEAAATGEMLAEGLLSKKVMITPEIATNLYVAISTDTGSFQYDHTSARTLEIAALLVHAGVRVGAISEAMYGSQPRRRFELLRHALNKAQISAQGCIASISLTLAEAEALNIRPEDTEGIIDPLRSIEGVLVAIFFEELSEGKIRLSLRSKTHCFSASDFCKKYGGGGHHMAAGARIVGSLSVIEEEIITKITNHLRLLHLPKISSFSPH